MKNNESITKDYSVPAVQEAIAKSFNKSELKSAHLYNFLNEKQASKLKVDLSKSKSTKEFRADSHSFNKLLTTKEISSIFQRELCKNNQ